MVLETFYKNFQTWIESVLSGRYWLWKLIAISVGLSLFLSFPPYQLVVKYLHGEINLDSWSFIEIQAQNLLRPEGIEEAIRRENMIMRWTLPGLSYITRHNLILMLIIQAALGVYFVYWIGKWAFQLTQDKILTTFFVLSISNTFVGIWHFAEVHGYGDGIAYFGLLAAMLHRKPWASFLFLLIAFFTDERAVLAGGFLLLWNMIQRAYDLNSFTPNTLFPAIFQGRNRVIWLGWRVYLSIRFYVKSTYFPDHEYSTIGTPELFDKMHRMGFGSSVWTTFEAFWFLLVGAALLLYLTQKKTLLGMLSLAFFILFLSTAFVHDIDRSLAYGFPFLLIAFFIFQKEASQRAFRLVMFICAMGCIIHPQVFYMGYNKIIWLEPLPLKIFQFIDHVFNWHIFH